MTPEGNNTSEPEPEPVRASTEERPKVVDQESAHGERTFDGRDHVELRQELQSPVIMWQFTVMSSDDACWGPELHVFKKGIRWNNPRPGSIYQKKFNCFQLNVIRWFLSGLHDKQSCRLTQLTLWCSHATRPLSHGENHIYSWWWCEKRKLTARRQSGVCSVALSLISASVSHSVALWSFRVVPNTKLLRRYVDTKWWMDKIPRYLVGFDLLTQTETQVHQNITENHFISPDF